MFQNKKRKLNELTILDIQMSLLDMVDPTIRNMIIPFITENVQFDGNTWERLLILFAYKAIEGRKIDT